MLSPMTSRRSLLSTTALLAGGWASLPSDLRAQLKRADVDPEFVVKNGRIRQSIMGWCFNSHFKAVELAAICKSIGLVAMEGIPREAYPEVKKMGLEISLVSSHGFAKGPCDPKFRDEVNTNLRESIAVAAGVGCKNVITFTGMRFDGMDDEKAANDCVEVWKTVLPDAEKAGVTLVLEHLNSRDNTHPMKGHPATSGTTSILRRTHHPRRLAELQAAFDIYHVSIMNGDIIRRIRQYKDVIGHYHPPATPAAPSSTTPRRSITRPSQGHPRDGYTGYVAQEFIPTWDDPVLALRQAAQVCDV